MKNAQIKPMGFTQYLKWLDRELVSRTQSRSTPIHPGKILEERVLELQGMSQTEFAKRLGCAHAKINEIVRGKRGITPKFALQLEEVTDIRAETWLRAQLYFDLWKLRDLQESTAIPQNQE